MLNVWCSLAVTRPNDKTALLLRVMEQIYRTINKDKIEIVLAFTSFEGFVTFFERISEP